MESIRRRLLRTFLYLIGIVVIGGLFAVSAMVWITQQYRSTSQVIITEYRLVAAPGGLIAAYNTRAESNANNTAQAEQEIKNEEENIRSLEAYLDAAITDKASLSDYIGLKNSLADLIQTIDASIAKIESGNLSGYDADYNNANQKYGFVKENGTTLIFSELNYIASLQQQTDRLYVICITLGIALLILTLAIGTIYSWRFSRAITTPLSRLTTLAQRIAHGDMEISMDPDLLERKDETGSLSQSFNVMVRQLKTKISELHHEKASVEHEVEQRTAELSHEKTRLAASIASLPLGFIMTDDDGELVSMNQEAHTILSYHLSRQGVSEQDTKETRDRWTLEKIDSKFGSHFSFKNELKQTLIKGKPVWHDNVEFNGRVLRLFFAPVKEESRKGPVTLGVIVLVEDVTEERLLARSRDEFFSIASHELRTPLTAIRGNSSMVRQFYGNTMDKEAAEMLEDIHDSSVRLIGIVNDFLDVSRLEQGRLELNMEVFSADEVIEQLIYEIANAYPGKKVHLAFEKPHKSLPNLYADKNRTKQILYNLIGNAMKFTEKGSVTVQVVPRGSTALQIEVTDTGPGINPESQRLLFRKFQQAGDSLFTRNTTQGTGLGLYISRALAEKMAGSVNLTRSEPGKGSTFAVVLPIEPITKSHA